LRRKAKKAGDDFVSAFNPVFRIKEKMNEDKK